MSAQKSHWAREARRARAVVGGSLKRVAARVALRAQVRDSTLQALICGCEREGRQENQHMCALWSCDAGLASRCWSNKVRARIWCPRRLPRVAGWICRACCSMCTEELFRGGELSVPRANGAGGADGRMPPGCGARRAYCVSGFWCTSSGARARDVRARERVQYAPAWLGRKHTHRRLSVTHTARAREVHVLTASRVSLA